MDLDKLFYGPAMEVLNQAVEADKAQKYKEAYHLYNEVVDKLSAGFRHDKFVQRVDAYKSKANQCVDRMIELKDVIDKPHTTGGGSGGATAAKGAGASDDAESAKLKDSLSGAIVSEKPNIKWDDVAGLEGAKEALKEAVILPARFPQLFVGKRKPWKGILLYGPPGTGKSYLAKAVATEANGTFFAVTSADLVSKWQGESERLVKSMFELARTKKPAIIFLDEIDSLCRERGRGDEGETSRRVLTTFLTQMDGVGVSNDGVLVLAATNVPWEIDSAVRRRFEKRIYIPLPDAQARGRMIKINLGNTPNNLAEGDFEELGKAMEGASGSDLSVLVREALMEPLRKCRQARYWRAVPAQAQPGAGAGASGKPSGMAWTPVEDDPPCSYCTPDLSTRPAPHKVPCRNCGCARIDLLELGSDELHVPEVCTEDFQRVMKKSRGSVAGRELKRYEEWTSEFGQDGV